MADKPDTPGECEEKLIDVLMQRRIWAWNSYHSRREYEWKVTLGVWTSLAASIAVLLTKGATIPDEIRHYHVAALVLLLGLHFWFVWGVMRANDKDRIGLAPAKRTP